MKKLTKLSILIARLLLPIILLDLIVLMISFLIAYEKDALLALRTYPYYMEYIVCAITLLLGGCLLAELAERNAK